MRMKNIIGTMVVCLACEKVVWAHDSGYWGDVRGLLNTMRMPCRLCGDENEWKGFDGWDITPSMGKGGDVWAAMRYVADENGFGWDNSPDLRWFHRDAPGEMRICESCWASRGLPAFEHRCKSLPAGCDCPCR
jgi:hypothetical protein